MWCYYISLFFYIFFFTLSAQSKLAMFKKNFVIFEANKFFNSDRCCYQYEYLEIVRQTVIVYFVVIFIFIDHNAL